MEESKVVRQGPTGGKKGRKKNRKQQAIQFDLYEKEQNEREQKKQEEHASFIKSQFESFKISPEADNKTSEAPEQSPSFLDIENELSCKQKKKLMPKPVEVSPFEFYDGVTMASVTSEASKQQQPSSSLTVLAQDKQPSKKEKPDDGIVKHIIEAAAADPKKGKRKKAAPNSVWGIKMDSDEELDFEDLLQEEKRKVEEQERRDMQMAQKLL
mmetsp:Transcript_37533/g.57506  ORF Transcript_37533/g.57506 Transcript_37533/m.57506 type:complete len:212 (-) Transcript_37533:261-896(-)